MKKVGRVILGFILAAVGVLLALNALGITDIEIFFDGWWALFLIVPCTVGIFTEKDKFNNLLGLLFGVFLLLCARDILDFSMLWKLLLPVLLVLFGAKLVLMALFGKKSETLTVLVKNGRKPNSVVAVFSGRDCSWDNQVFEGAELVTVFGGIECNLKNTIIENDCTIDVVCIFGGVDILVPSNVNVDVSSVSIFGGTDNKTLAKSDAPTITINSFCMFGGIDIK